ncbi:cell wall hydrolase [Sphingomonas sp. RS2018]
MALSILLVVVIAAVLGGDRYRIGGPVERPKPVAVTRGPAPTTAPTPTAEEVAVLLDTTAKAIPPQDAVAINAARPLDRRSLIPARLFALPQLPETATGNAAALDCMTKAVYYEAASESDRGERAVAQVVLNRMRSPIFPHTVCGVVFQGSERVTGCQFSFTCDGSLRRRPSEAGWLRARRIAAAALAGWVEPSVGLATHYHANYVVPYWADSLDKAATIGAHIFYVMRGGLGRPAGFREPYAAMLEGGVTTGLGDAALETLTGDEVLATAAETTEPKERTVVREDNLGAPTHAPVLVDKPAPRLRADEGASGLVIDGSKGVLRPDK